MLDLGNPARGATKRVSVVDGSRKRTANGCVCRDFELVRDGDFCSHSAVCGTLKLSGRSVRLSRVLWSVGLQAKANG